MYLELSLIVQIYLPSLSFSDHSILNYLFFKHLIKLRFYPAL